MSIDEFTRLIERRLPPAPENEVAEFEESIGASLPTDYRRFLIACNGGWLGGRLWYFGPTPDGTAADAGIHHVGGMRSEPHLSLAAMRASYGPRVPSALTWIMSDPFGNAICIGVHGAQRDRIYFWDHEAEPPVSTWDGRVETAGNVHLLANSFSSFVAGLRRP